MARPRRRGIRTKISVAVLVVALLPLAGASVVSWLSARRTGEAQAIDRLAGIAAVQEARVNAYADSSLESLALVASRTQLRRSFAAELQRSDPANTELMERILGDAVASSATARRIELVGVDGRVVASSDGVGLGLDRTDVVAFQRGLEGPDLSTVRTSADASGVDRVGVHSRPIELDGEMLGVILVEASLDPLDRLMADYTGLGASGETILASARDLESVDLLGPVRFPEELADESVAESALLARALGGTEGDVSDQLDYRGERVFAVARAVDRVPGWALAVKIDRSEALAEADRLGTLLLVALAVATLVVSVASWLLTRTLTRPIVRLHETALAIASGDTTRRVEVTTDDELGELATEFNRMTDELVDANARLRAANEQLEEFVYISSHDLKSPLRSISSFSQLLESEYGGLLDASGRRYLDYIHDGSSRMHAVIEDLLDYLRIDKADQLMDLVDLDTVLDQVIDLHRPDLDRAEATIERVPLPTVLGNAALLGQMVDNIVQNAIRYRRPNVPLVLDVVAGRYRDLWQISFADNGRGVPADRRMHAFEAFRRLSDEGEGTGMGLAICRRIARTHGGDIAMADSRHGGVALVVTLRAAPNGDDPVVP